MMNLDSFGVEELSHEEKAETNGGLSLSLNKWWQYALAALAIAAVIVLL